MGGADGDALLQEVVSICTDSSLAHFHDWREDDMVLCDNWRTLHCAPGVPLEETRVMERTTISGDYTLGRALGSGSVVNFDISLELGDLPPVS